MLRLLPAMLLAVLLLAACDDDANAPNPPQLSEDYDVYSALLDQHFTADQTERVVILDSTEVYDLSHPDMRQYLITNLGVTEATLQSYDTANTAKRQLQKKFDTIAEAILINESDFRVILDQGGWEEFHTQYPKSSGLITLSGVGYAADGNTAIVYASNMVGFLAGSGICVVLERTVDGWNVMNYTIVWVS
ncbi:MAG: hypothetical protein C0600_03715 [Ignavibacteria bacterium]|nr:MAG: hypothetical protein C0600_03715 [Ignavibacteria bacterium]